MILRAISVWFVLMIAAIVNGTIRTFLIVPYTGDGIGRAISTFMLSGIILLIARLSIGWIAPRNHRAAWLVGGRWLLLTLAFEFGAGHFLFRNPWERLLEDYDITRGRIWVLVLLACATAPRLAFRSSRARIHETFT